MSSRRCGSRRRGLLCSAPRASPSLLLARSALGCAGRGTGTGARSGPVHYCRRRASFRTSIPPPSRFNPVVARPRRTPWWPFSSGCRSANCFPVNYKLIRCENFTRTRSGRRRISFFPSGSPGADPGTGAQALAWWRGGCPRDAGSGGTCIPAVQQRQAVATDRGTANRFRRPSGGRKNTIR